MIGRSTQIITEALATEWVRHFRKTPLVTSAATLTAIAILVVVGIKVDAHQKEVRQTARLENASYKDQVDRLNEMETNVTQLLSFIDGQKRTLNATQDTISKLETERDRLKPLVESDKRVVEAVFQIQEDRASASIWRERWIGFGLGVIASLVASFMWFVVMKLARNQSTGSDFAPSA
ncbi:hypothetical protein FEM03_13500 [Phragmitibacter flavus]|uniref:Uncharacterized protein n=1 Tax=Phragmitibacter flavus TaxID=2576071 RepID=A0A5R8KD24_9BACT|nr:hypothetical protein [Phragmitibacter flavus]TLD70200.1 hypothetical protein FEM03_13500 [Phragmitibacter flavus]